MWNLPMEYLLAEIPALYETKNQEFKNKLIYVHFFLGNSDWFVCEYDGKDTFWGFVILNGDILNAEWGYYFFSELQSINIYGVQIDCVPDEYWEIKPAAQIEKISQAQGWNIPIKMDRQPDTATV